MTLKPRVARFTMNDVSLVCVFCFAVCGAKNAFWLQNLEWPLEKKVPHSSYNSSIV